jgi:hypothetical protein
MKLSGLVRRGTSGMYVTPHMVTNSFQEWAVPIWEIFVFPNGDPRMVTGIPVW